MSDLSIFKLDSQTITIKDTTARQTAESAKTLATTAAAAGNAVREQITELKNDLTDVQDIVYVKKRKSWRGNSSYPLGWRTGYYTKDVGEEISTTNSNNYIRAYYSVNESDIGENFDQIIFTPPTGYYIAVKTVNSSNIITGVYGGQGYSGKEIKIDHVTGEAYAVYVGRFNGNAGEYYNNEDFIATIQMHILVRQDFITRQEAEIYMIENGAIWN